VALLSFRRFTTTATALQTGFAGVGDASTCVEKASNRAIESDIVKKVLMIGKMLPTSKSTSLRYIAVARSSIDNEVLSNALVDA
jgi:hypothetical protein